MLPSGRNGTLDHGVTNDLVRRVYERTCRSVHGLTRRYDVDRLVWFELHTDITVAIQREKHLKRWLRAHGRLL